MLQTDGSNEVVSVYENQEIVIFESITHTRRRFPLRFELSEIGRKVSRTHIYIAFLASTINIVEATKHEHVLL